MTLADGAARSIPWLDSLLAGKEWNEWRFVLQAPWGRAGVIVAGVVAAAVLLLSFLGTRGERSPARRALLLVLRAGSVAAALVLFLQPAIQLENVTRLPNRVAVLVDASASMGLAEQPGAGTRAERTARLVGGAGAAFDAWRKEHHLDFYTFSDGSDGNGPAAGGGAVATGASETGGLTPTSEQQLAQAGSATGEATRMREALAALRARYERRDLGGVVVISDGIDNGRFGAAAAAAAAAQKGGEEPEALDAEGREFLRGLDAPVHTVWTGRAGLRDLAIARVLADDFAFAKSAIKVEAVVRVLGAGSWAGRRVPVMLKRDGVPVRTVEVTIDPDQPEQKITFEFTPDRVGKFLYEITAPVLEGDAIPENNHRLFLLKVIRDKIRALLVAGRPSWDERFLRGLLKHNPNVDLISFFILRTPADIEAAPPDEMSLIPFPTEELFLEQLKSFDVVFLQNFNFGPYGIGAYLEQIKGYVLDGGGLAMIGGDLSFTSGGWAHTPVADVLPVELLEPGPEESLLSPEPFRMRLGAEGRAHPITTLRLDPRENASRWEALPPLDGMNLVARAKPGATVLGVHPALRASDGRPMPAIAVTEAGKGRTLAFLSDSSWRWGFGAAAAPTDESGARAYQRFWENAIRWLVRDPELRLLRVESDQGEYRARERPRIAVRAFDAEYKPAANIDVQLAFSRVGAAPGEPPPAPPRTVRTDESGEALVELEALPPGGYRVSARAPRGAPSTGGTGGSGPSLAMQDEEVFLVRGAARELEDPEARDGLLRAIADASGGRYLGESPSTAELSALPFSAPEVVRVNKHHDLELWSTWLTLLCATLLLSIEWALRRRYGLL